MDKIAVLNDEGSLQMWSLSVHNEQVQFEVMPSFDLKYTVSAISWYPKSPNKVNKKLFIFLFLLNNAALF